MPDEQATAAPLTTERRLRSIAGGSIGNLVEWYDWYVYSAFSLYFAKAFFPNSDPTAQLLNSAAIFAVGSLVVAERQAGTLAWVASKPVSRSAAWALRQSGSRCAVHAHGARAE